MTNDQRAIAPESNSVAVEIGDKLLVLDADDAAELRGRLGLALGELRAAQATHD